MPSSQPGLKRRWELLVTLVQADMRDQRDLTVIGLAKWLLEPLTYMVMYYVLVGVVFDRQQFAYPVFLLCALLPWRYFQEVTSRSMALVPTYGNLISSRAIPRRVLPLVVIVSEGINFVVALALLAPLMARYQIGPTFALLWLPVICAVLAILVAGPAYVCAVFGLYFPDYRGVVLSMTRIAFFASTALVAARKIPGDTLPRVMQANPLSGIFDSFRDIFLRERAPEVWHLAYPLLVGLALLLVGLGLYAWREFEFAKEV